MEAKSQEIKSVQNEEFWKRHYETLKSIGIRRSEYCQQYNLNYDRFGYWICRWKKFKKNNNGLIGIKIKQENHSSELKILCTINLRNGLVLKIHESTALEIILERYR